MFINVSLILDVNPIIYVQCIVTTSIHRGYNWSHWSLYSLLHNIDLYSLNATETKIKVGQMFIEYYLKVARIQLAEYRLYKFSLANFLAYYRFVYLIWLNRKGKLEKMIARIGFNVTKLKVRRIVNWLWCKSFLCSIQNIAGFAEFQIKQLISRLFHSNISTGHWIIRIEHEWFAQLLHSSRNIHLLDITHS